MGVREMNSYFYIVRNQLYVIGPVFKVKINFFNNVHYFAIFGDTQNTNIKLLRRNVLHSL